MINLLRTFLGSFLLNFRGFGCCVKASRSDQRSGVSDFIFSDNSSKPVEIKVAVRTSSESGETKYGASFSSPREISSFINCNVKPLITVVAPSGLFFFDPGGLGGWAQRFRMLCSFGLRNSIVLSTRIFES
jgi:hypothetical protein